MLIPEPKYGGGTVHHFYLMYHICQMFEHISFTVQRTGGGSHEIHTAVAFLPGAVYKFTGLTLFQCVLSHLFQVGEAVWHPSSSTLWMKCSGQAQVAAAETCLKIQPLRLLDVVYMVSPTETILQT